MSVLASVIVVVGCCVAGFAVAVAVSAPRERRRRLAANARAAELTQRILDVSPMDPEVAALWHVVPSCVQRDAPAVALRELAAELEAGRSVQAAEECTFSCDAPDVVTVMFIGESYTCSTAKLVAALREAAAAL
jgi:hypothetical protein